MPNVRMTARRVVTGGHDDPMDAPRSVGLDEIAWLLDHNPNAEARDLLDEVRLIVDAHR